MKHPLMQTITVAEVKTAALKAHAEGRLTAQGPWAGSMRGCSYCEGHEGKLYGCAVGVALTEETTDYIRASGNTNKRLSVLVTLGILAVDDRTTLDRIQEAHDAWVSVLDTAGRAHYEAEFLKLIH